MIQPHRRGGQNHINKLKNEKNEFIRSNAKAVQNALTKTLAGVPVEFEPHIEFKKRVPRAIGLIRTGDTVQYTNIIIESA